MAEDYPVRVLRVIDGDSVKVRLPDGEEYSVRMYGIDAPELAQERGGEAQRYLERVVDSERKWRLAVVDTDRYHRLVGILYPEGGSPHASANHEVVERGLAYWYRDYGGAEYGFDRAERQAQRERAGVWSDAGAERPWDFRKARRGRSGAGKSGPSSWDVLVGIFRLMAKIMKAFSARASAGSSSRSRSRSSTAITARSVERALSGGRRRSSNPFKPRRRRRKKLF